jgi:hypothetical protein
VTVSGTLTAGGAPIAGVAVDLQRRTAEGQMTIATGTTNSDGSWSASAQLESYATLRAVFRGDPAHNAVVTQTFNVGVRPQVTLSAAAPGTLPGGTIEFTGTITPGKPRAEIVMAKQGPDGSFAEVRRIAVAVDAGSFRRTIGFPEAGRYQLIALSQPDAANPAGQSPPVEIVVA